MAEPVRLYTPRRDPQEELRRRVERAPVDHAGALLAAYELLQEAQDHGVFDTLRGAIGAGQTIIGKASDYANTPEGIRLMRNLLSAARLLGELNPAIMDAATKALSSTSGEWKEHSEPPSLWRSLQRLTGKDSRRTLATIAAFSESFGKAQSAEASEPGAGRDKGPSASGVAIPVIASAVVVMLAGFWMSRKRS